MATVVGANCGTGTLSGLTCDVVLTQNIPQSTPTNGQVILLFFEQWTNSFPGGLLSAVGDNGSTPGVGYGGAPNQLVPGGAGSSGSTGLTFTWSLGCSIYGILNPLVIGDIITFTFGVAPDYFRVTAFPASEVIAGACMSFNFPSFATPSNAFFNPDTSSSLPVTVSAPVNFGFYVVGEVATPGVGSLSWQDTGVVLLDSWYDDGPTSDTSFACGYRATPPGTYDIGTITDVTPSNADPTRVGVVGYSTAFFEGGLGLSYCSTPGSPCFNARLSLRDPGVGTLTPAAVPMLNGRFRLTDTPDPSTLTPAPVPMLGSRFRLLNQAVR